METSVVYRVKYFVKYIWNVTTYYKYFTEKEHAQNFLKGLDQNLAQPPCIETVGVISDGTNSYCLGPAIVIET